MAEETLDVPPRRRKLPLSRRWLSARGRSLEITKAGYLFVLLTLAIGFAAINSGSNLLHIIFGVQLGVVIASGILSERMVWRANPHRQVTSPLFAGSPGALRVDLRNTSERGVLFSVSVEDDDSYEGMGTCAPVFSLTLGPEEETRMHSSVTLPRRGLHKLPPAVVVTRFPFGLFVKRKELARDEEVIVFPRIHALASQGEGAAIVGDGERSGRVARAGEFYGLDEYREGHELRRVHWAATARRGKLIVQEYEGEGDRTVMLELGSGRSGEPGYEAQIEELASQAVAALRGGGVAVGLTISGEIVVPPGSGAAHEVKILERLALVGFESMQPGGVIEDNNLGETAA